MVWRVRNRSQPTVAKLAEDRAEQLRCDPDKITRCLLCELSQLEPIC